MGLAKLNVWISKVGNPCEVSDRTWYVNIYNCEGNILEWCKRRFVVLKAPCGHLEVEVPPGCYVINAVWGYWIDAKDVLHGNHFTHNAIVQATCDKTTCVRLFTPKAHSCGVIFRLAVMDLVRQDLVPRAVANRLNVAMDETLKYTPEPVKKFELGILRELKEVAKEQKQSKEQEE
jgi:hypothetical protein